MKQAFERVAAAFPDFKLATQPRPDGYYLLVLQRQDGKELKRAVPSTQFSAPERVDWLISAIRRDLAQEAGLPPPSVTTLQSQSRSCLPTYL
ncbi:hypothetical protein BZL41_18035 [Pseudomonas sp. PIC25]|uniref:DUF3509 domain-containing protein n=1 Tax=Pseudomonas sp. PIC25 TaxID=1958773 RepID=UPI000BAB7811|nr:DUF3509 domain-containing protein [Pseudomonas sp. PIC25]PAU58416.1 hypothetical protein BZL41_18035 [Pseudomonas sp. PIC25]